MAGSWILEGCGNWPDFELPTRKVARERGYIFNSFLAFSPRIFVLLPSLRAVRLTPLVHVRVWQSRMQINRSAKPLTPRQDRPELALQSHEQLRRHFTDFIAAYNFGRRRGPLLVQ